MFDQFVGKDARFCIVTELKLLDVQPVGKQEQKPRKMDPENEKRNLILLDVLSCDDLVNFSNSAKNLKSKLGFFVFPNTTDGSDPDIIVSFSSLYVKRLLFSKKSALLCLTVIHRIKSIYPLSKESLLLDTVGGRQYSLLY